MLADTIKPTVIDLINSFGTDITLKKPSASVYNPATGTVETTAGTSKVIKAIVESYQAQEIQGMVQAGDIKLTIANDDVDISIKDDTILFAGLSYNIINKMPSIIEGVVISYELQIRR